MMKIRHILATLALVAVGSVPIAEAGNPNPGVIPIGSHAFGKTYGEWGQEFVKWVFQFSLEDYPLFQGDGDQDCSAGQSGKVWFLHGTLSGISERNCVIPPGKALFISVNSALSFVPVFGNTEEEIRQDAKKDLDGTDTTLGVTTLEVYIDGVPLNDPYSYRADSPEGGFTFTIDEGTILNQIGFESGDYDPAIVDGYWVLLTPLSAGNHTIRWLSSGQSQSGDFYSYDAIWHLSVGK